jgi:hypothetical protein
MWKYRWYCSEQTTTSVAKVGIFQLLGNIKNVELKEHYLHISVLFLTFKGKLKY